MNRCAAQKWDIIFDSTCRISRTNGESNCLCCVILLVLLIALNFITAQVITFLGHFWSRQHSKRCCSIESNNDELCSSHRIFRQFLHVPSIVGLFASKRNIRLGMVRVNRIPNCKLPADNAIKNEPRGFSTEFVASAYGIEMSNVLRKDKKAVRLISTYVGVEPFGRTNPDQQVAKAARFDRKAKKYVEIDCPQIIR